MAKTRRTRMSAEKDHLRVTRPRLRIIVKETQGYPTGYLQAPSDTVEYDLEPRKVSGLRADYMYEAVYGFKPEKRLVDDGSGGFQLPEMTRAFSYGGSFQLLNN